MNILSACRTEVVNEEAESHPHDYCSEHHKLRECREESTPDTHGHNVCYPSDPGIACDRQQGNAYQKE